MALFSSPMALLTFSSVDLKIADRAPASLRSPLVFNSPQFNRMFCDRIGNAFRRPSPLVASTKDLRKLPSIRTRCLSDSNDKQESKFHSEIITLDSIRDVLIRLEDTIIFSLLERAQYSYNPDTYEKAICYGNERYCSMIEFMVRETEKLHARVGRYKSPDEHPFFPDALSEPLLLPVRYPKVLHPIADNININKKIWEMYFQNLLPGMVEEGSDGNCGSSAVCDIICLQAFSKRIHYGKFVAESKFLEKPDAYTPVIEAQDSKELMRLLTYPKIESDVKRRVEKKAKIFGRQVTLDDEKDEESVPYKIEPSLVVELYGRWIMPLTKEVEVEYLLRRLD